VIDALSESAIDKLLVNSDYAAVLPSARASAFPYQGAQSGGA
jgi:hypothetical protein